MSLPDRILVLGQLCIGVGLLLAVFPPCDQAAGVLLVKPELCAFELIGLLLQIADTVSAVPDCGFAEIPDLTVLDGLLLSQHEVLADGVIDCRFDEFFVVAFSHRTVSIPVMSGVAALIGHAAIFELSPGHDPLAVSAADKPTQWIIGYLARFVIAFANDTLSKQKGFFADARFMCPLNNDGFLWDCFSAANAAAFPPVADQSAGIDLIFQDAQHHRYIPS